MATDRIAIIGKPGAGKTTCASRLAHLLDSPHVELDGYFWEPNWTPVSDAVFNQRAGAVLSPHGQWVADGSYTEIRELVWSRAQTVVWLDMPLSLTFWRLFWRIWARWWHGAVLWQGNRERLRDHFCSVGENNLFGAAMRMHWRDRELYPTLLRQHAHLRVLRFRTPAELDEWLRSLKKSGKESL